MTARSRIDREHGKVKNGRVYRISIGGIAAKRPPQAHVNRSQPLRHVRRHFPLLVDAWANLSHQTTDTVKQP
ncbi:hypothetical protein CPY51_22190 [Rhizobium tubonense]|uniref:Uncharacterized protein n=1 Tax=Rhizobium tubonense TaxID=484088 RepID=A0A2W4EG74_9HYPH|nr:hypothetical protein CPY51_22190 [Rhizobium tubonense]